MANIDITKVEEIIQCPICLEQYNGEDRAPKQIPCLHTICLDCLQDIINKINSVEYECPMCRVNFTPPQNGVGSLPNNYTVVQLVDLFKASSNTQAPTASSDVEQNRETQEPIATDEAILYEQMMKLAIAISKSQSQLTTISNVFDNSARSRDAENQIRDGLIPTAPITEENGRDQTTTANDNMLEEDAIRIALDISAAEGQNRGESNIAIADSHRNDLVEESHRDETGTANNEVSEEDQLRIALAISAAERQSPVIGDKRIHYATNTIEESRMLRLASEMSLNDIKLDQQVTPFPTKGDTRRKPSNSKRRRRFPCTII